MSRNIKLFEEQGEAFNSPKQFIIVVCGSQSGKTFLGATWARNKMAQFPAKNGLISAPTNKVLLQSTLDKLFSMFPELRPFYREQKQEIQLPGGGRVFVRSADTPLLIEGMTIHWGWLDEYGQASRLAWTVCKTRTSTTGGQLMVTTTPYALNWLYEEGFKPWRDKVDQRISFHTWNSITNPHFLPEHYEAEKAALSKEEFGRRYEGKFTRMAGMVYPEFTEELISPWREIDTVESFAGVDFGFTHPAAVVVIKKDKNKHYWVVDEFYEAGKDQNEINEVCQIFIKKYNFNTFYPDSAEPDRILAMQRAKPNIVCRESNKDVTFGIDRVRQLFREKRLHVFQNCYNLIDELNTYHYDENIERGIKEEPVKEKDDAVDALRYAISSHPMAELSGKAHDATPEPKMGESPNMIDFKKLISQDTEGNDSWKYY